MRVAFLRGINIGSRRTTNDELVACFEAMGFGTVSGFLASGNVLFDTGDDEATALETRIAIGLESALGYPVPTFVRTAKEIEAIQARAPFPPEVVATTGGNMQVALLGSVPSATQRLEALAVPPPEDLIDLNHKEMYWLPKAGISDSKLNLNAVADILGPVTIRTQRTMARLAAKLA